MGHQKHLSTENDDEIHNNDSEHKDLGSNINNIENINKRKEDKEEIVVVETRFCTVCCLEQPLRAKHCRECGKCVALHDHHCPWLGICIGEKNRFYFWWYLLFQCSFLWVSEVVVIKSFETASGIQWMKENIGRLLIVVIISFFIFMVTCLLGYHTFLAMVNQTTWENVSWEKISYLKHRPRKLGGAFSKGILRNLWFYCCEKLPNSHIIWKITKK